LRLGRLNDCRLDDKEVRDTGITVLRAATSTHGRVGGFVTRVVAEAFMDSLDGVGIVSATTGTTSVSEWLRKSRGQDLPWGYSSEHVVGTSSLAHLGSQDTIGKGNRVAEASGVNSGTSPVLEVLRSRLVRSIGCLAKGDRKAKDGDKETGEHGELW
jgi:hypothetical protein